MPILSKDGFVPVMSPEAATVDREIMRGHWDVPIPPEDDFASSDRKHRASLQLDPLEGEIVPLPRPNRHELQLHLERFMPTGVTDAVKRQHVQAVEEVAEMYGIELHPKDKKPKKPPRPTGRLPKVQAPK